MSGKNKGIKISDSEDDEYDGQVSITELDLPLEKLNIGPKKKLLVMNNGILFYRCHSSRKKQIPSFLQPDLKYGSYLVFKRPFCAEFMRFCLERFEVGIWSSAMEHNIDKSLDCAIGDSKRKLLLVWDQGRCTNSGFKSVEHASKPLFFKELNQVWKNVKKGGPYSASNTLLIDSNPYKAFLNPPNTAIFPESYEADNSADKTLDPKGELCLFLEGLASASDVQSYVKNHRIGRDPVTSSHPDWKYYSDVKESVLKRRLLNGGRFS